MSAPVEKPEGGVAGCGHEAVCRVVLYHIAPTALAFVGGAMGVPALKAVMKEVSSGCHATCDQLAWLA